MRRCEREIDTNESMSKRKGGRKGERHRWREDPKEMVLNKEETYGIKSPSVQTLEGDDGRECE